MQSFQVRPKFISSITRIESLVLVFCYILKNKFTVIGALNHVTFIWPRERHGPITDSFTVQSDVFMLISNGVGGTILVGKDSSTQWSWNKEKWSVPLNKQTSNICFTCRNLDKVTYIKLSRSLKTNLSGSCAYTCPNFIVCDEVCTRYHYWPLRRPMTDALMQSGSTCWGYQATGCILM